MESNNKEKNRVKVEVIEFGPLKITGNFVIKDIKRNNETTPGEILLCRCGKTENKPYCDGARPNGTCKNLVSDRNTE